MSWYRDNDGKIITDEEFQDDCCNCSAFCSEGSITVPCNGERTDCAYYKEVDTSEYDKVIRNKAVDDFAEQMKERLKGMQMAELQGEDICPCSENGEDCQYINQDIGCQYCAREQTIKDIDKIAEQLKAGDEV